jgi:hypothetical protein
VSRDREEAVFGLFTQTLTVTVLKSDAEKSVQKVEGAPSQRWTIRSESSLRAVPTIHIIVNGHVTLTGAVGSRGVPGVFSVTPGVFQLPTLC